MTIEAFSVAGPASMMTSCWPRVIRGLLLHGIACGAQVAVSTVTASLAVAAGISPSQMIRVNHRLGERRRRFLWQVVTDAATDEAELVVAGEALRIVFRQRVRCAVGVAFKGDGRYANRR